MLILGLCSYGLQAEKGIELLRCDARQDHADNIGFVNRGSGLLARFYTWHAECLLALIFISVGYFHPSDVAFDPGWFRCTFNYLGRD